MSDNDNLELKKRSRRRLVGAAALALIAAIVLPMVMDGEPVVPVSDIQVTIPERTVDARPIASREPIVEPVAEPVAVPETPAVVEVEQAAPTPKPAPAPPKPEAAPAAKPAPTPAPTQAPTAAPAAVPPAAVAPAEPEESAEARRARAILEGRAVPPAPVESNQFLVQVGAFSDRSKAEARQVELAARGFKTFIETGEGVSRVRLGPFASRSDAEAMIARLRAASIDGVVTTR